MNLTSKIDFRLTKKRIRMLGSSRSRLRSIPRALFIIPLLSTLSLMFCADSTNINDNLSHTELSEMFPTTYEDVELTTNEGWFWIDEHGKSYSGTQNVYNIENNQLITTHQFSEGIMTQSEFYHYDDDWRIQSKGLSLYSIDTDGNRKTELYRNAHSDSMYLFMVYLENDSDKYDTTVYYENGQIMSTWTMLAYNVQTMGYHGLRSEYDEDGNVTKQEIFDKGQLVETIK